LASANARRLGCDDVQTVAVRGQTRRTRSVSVAYKLPPRRYPHREPMVTTTAADPNTLGDWCHTRPHWGILIGGDDAFYAMVVEPADCVDGQPACCDPRWVRLRTAAVSRDRTCGFDKRRVDRPTVIPYGAGPVGTTTLDHREIRCVLARLLDAFGTSPSIRCARKRACVHTMLEKGGGGATWLSGHCTVLKVCLHVADTHVNNNNDNNDNNT